MDNLLLEALRKITELPHDVECNVRMHGRGHLGCSCHVGIAMRAIEAWIDRQVQEEKPAEHVAVVRLAEPGTVHFVPPFMDKRGAIIDRMDVRNNADGSISIGIATLATVRQDPLAETGTTGEALDRCAHLLFPKLRVVAKRWPAQPDHPAEKALAREVVEEVLANLGGGTVDEEKCVRELAESR